MTLHSQARRRTVALSMINGDRVRQAREIRGLTQKGLAALADVHQSNIARIEQNAISPSDTVVDAIALHTNFPAAFFSQDTGPEFPLGTLLFRKRARLLSVDRDQVRQSARLAFELYERLSGKFRGYEVRIPRLNERPSMAAKIARSALGYSPDAPITDLIYRLEKNGIIALSLPVELKDHDAFSLWADSEPRKPTIVITAGKPGDRMRFNIAHELGHLVLHRAVSGSTNEVEKQADEFAAEFLMPREVIRHELKSPLTLSSLGQMKLRWGVSMQALAMRARDLNLITERQCKYLFQQLSARGWRVEEPGYVPLEKPRLLRKMVELIYGANPATERIAELVSSPVQLIAQLIDCYAGPPRVLSNTPETNIIQFRPAQNT